MKYIIYILLFFPIWVTAQTYKYIGIENGLSNRRIFNIQKDTQGYMWFLTNEGMDRYNGKDIKHYKLNKEASTLDAPVRLGWLYTGPQIGIWVIGKQGRVFRYEANEDDFRMVYKLPDISETISCGYLDRNNNIWLCCKDSILLYNINDAHILQFSNILHSNITAIEQIDEQHFFIATELGVRYVKLENGILETIPVKTLDYFHAQVSELYFHKQLKRLFIGSFERGVFVYDMNTQEIIRPEADLSDVNIARISPLNETELLIATEGMGVYKVNANTCELEHYIVANYQSYNEMNGNNINDVFVDEEKRIWLANYPTGITVIDNRYENYHWMKHAMGNVQSLINDQVQAVIEDHEGDLWFGTSNGISLYNSKTGQWHSFLSSFNQQLKDKNHIFITLCEVSPGIIWAGGYTSGIYKINKNTLSVEYFSPYLLSHVNMRPDKYIRDIVKDSRGYIWSGGYYNLKCFDLETNTTRLYSGLNSITSIVEKDKDNMWIGTAIGLYLLNRNTGEYQYIEMEVGITYINTLYQADNGLLYILEELLEEETLTDNGITRTNIALRNVEVLLRLVSNLINFERTDVYSSKMSVSEYELNTYMNEIYDTFSSYAAIRRIEYTYESTFSYMNVSFDKEKMDSILKNIISNSLKYTPENGKVSISVSDTNDSWKVIIKDTGIGIPASEQSKLFKLHFRASNAINSKVTGSGIGLMLVGKLVSLHGGKISVDSVEHQGTTIKIVFPKKNKTSQNISDEAPSKFEALAPVLPAPNVPAKTTATIDNPNLRRILVVEDNDELRSYLVSSLSSIYNVQACANGKEALIIIKEYWPELVLSDIMMPEMRGDELCVAIKSDIEISHIPVLLLTALGEENNILDGLSIGADEYLIKPFSVKILRANIANLLANRELLRMRYANLDIEAKSMVPSANGTNSLDWKFISNVKKIVDENINNPEFSVNVLCESSGMSRTSFYCKLKALTGQSPTEFIRVMRLKRATELLKEGEYAINEISDMVGFSETKYFREVFKKYYKMSPSRYAKGGGNPTAADMEDDDED